MKIIKADESKVNIESVRVPYVRDSYGILSDLGKSIATDGVRHPITLWTDGTLISGSRRLRAHFLMAGEPGGAKYRHIPAVFVDTIEDAAKHLHDDISDGHEALPMKSTEILRLWKVLQGLDGPAAIVRADEARRRGVELRRLTVAGKRKPGKSHRATEDYALGVLAAPFGMSESTAQRLCMIDTLSRSATDPRQEQARQALLDIDDGQSSIWANYARLTSGTVAPPSKPKPVVPIEPAPAARQLSAWAKALPQMEGLVNGLAELGLPNRVLTRQEIDPVRVRLVYVRRTLEKMIKEMKENDQ